MLEFIGGLLVDLCLFGGIALFGMSFFKKFKKHQFKMIIFSIVLLVLWIVFIDMAALSEAFQQGVEAGRGNQ
ncbi:MAG: hypothetical protein U5K72_18760 [Balneolaceae bacterium]|nr:hypothetical protein [Balneolaceae bacterium]